MNHIISKSLMINLFSIQSEHNASFFLSLEYIIFFCFLFFYLKRISIISANFS
jgi:hypothetical protein